MRVCKYKFLICFSSILLLSAPANAVVNHEGVTKNPDGTYTFSRLHIGGQGRIKDEKGEEVYLLGINAVNPFEGHGGDLIVPELLMSKPSNIVRVNFNTRWYVEDAYVPRQGIHFKQWLKQIVSTLESNGFYVELDAGTCFWEPPAGNDHKGVNITLSPHQNQGSLDYQQNPNTHTLEGLSSYQPIALRALAEIAATYANDPAILINVWNEPLYTYYGNDARAKTQFFANMNERIDLVRNYAPDMPIIVYSNSIEEMISGLYPIYQQKNLIVDFHLYQMDNQASIMEKFRLLHSKGFGVMVGEWGGRDPDVSYVNTMLSLSQRNHVGLLYFELNNLVDKTGINSFGTQVFGGYKKIFNSN